MEPWKLERLPGLQLVSERGLITYVHKNPEDQNPEDQNPEDEHAEVDQHPGAQEHAEVDQAAAQAVEAKVQSQAESEGQMEVTVNLRPAGSPAVETVVRTAEDEEAADASGDVDEEEGPLYPYRAAPRGYAVEFGTGRLIPIQYTPNGVQISPLSSRQRY